MVPRSPQPPIITRARVFANAGAHAARSALSRWERPWGGFRKSKRVSATRFEAVLADHSSDTIFLHAGLSAVKDAFDRNPYTYLRDVLSDHFDHLLAPGFTPSFRNSGMYHKLYSRPEYGAFSRLFLSDAEYRTDDAIHSILVDGAYRFEDCTHQNTFGSAGCWAKLDAENVLYCNIGTDQLKCTNLHFIEEVHDVPYLEHPSHDGVIYYDTEDHERIAQTNHAHNRLAHWNRRKIEERLHDQQVLDQYVMDGLTVNMFRARDMRAALAPAIENDPYFLIT